MLVYIKAKHNIEKTVKAKNINLSKFSANKFSKFTGI